MPIKGVDVELGYGPAKLVGRWEPDKAEREAAWELYVELVTRIAVVPLEPGTGILREALTSFYQLFGETRKILRAHGPAIARPPRRNGQYRFGYIAVWVLNGVIRPVLASWHPALQEWEATKPEGRSVVEHERSWDRAAELRTELEEVRRVLLQYAQTLATVCEAPALIDATHAVLRARHQPPAT